MAYITARLPDDLDAEIEALRNRINYAGLLPVRVTKSDLVRLALEYLLNLERQGRIEDALRKKPPSS